jgi:hypothetical protein
MASFGKPQNIKLSRWHAFVIIFLISSCHYIFLADSASAQSCNPSWDILGTSGIKTTYKSGETISGNISFRLNNPSSCPSCIQQILVAIVDSQNKVIDVQCVYNGAPKACPQWTTGTASFSLKNPNTLGAYKIIAADYYQYSCSDAVGKFPNPYNPTPPYYYKDITTITVYAPSSASPPQENISGQICAGNWDISGTSGIKTDYQLGETISGDISFKINNPSDCPTCIQQILVGLVDSQNKVIDVKCIYDGTPKMCPLQTTGTVSTSWKNPASPGVYRILVNQDANYSCADSKLNFSPKDSYKNIATVTVYASEAGNQSVAPAISPTSPPTEGNKTTGSSGSGITQDGAAPTAGNNTMIIIVVVALLVLLFIFSLSGPRTQKRIFRYILILAVISFIGYLFWIYGIPVVKKWIGENKSTIINVLTTLGALAIAGIVLWINRYKIGEWIKKLLAPISPPEPDEPDIDQLCDKIKKRIESLTIPRRHKTEGPYQDQLFQWLRSEFNVNYEEKHAGTGRPDLVIDDIIAIEVKGPATNDSLKDLKNKTKYIAPNTKYKRLICVLFEHDYSDSKYNEITQALKTLYHNKIVFIQK